MKTLGKHQCLENFLGYFPLRAMLQTSCLTTRNAGHRKKVYISRKLIDIFLGKLGEVIKKENIM